MGDLICIILVSIFIILAISESNLKKELKGKPYWNQLPKGTAVFGYLLPIIWVLICNDTKFFALRVIICLIITLFFIFCVYSLDISLRKDYPDEDRKKIVRYTLLTPILMIYYFVIIGIVLDFIRALKRQKRSS
ncbi:MAG: hypothetical protein ACXAHE_24260 [Roseburia sp. 1XD42-69]|jgi:hypothetical protein